MTTTQTLADLLTHPKMSSIDTLAKLQARLVGMGYGVDCGRCFGSGRYGPQSVQGGRCFGCGGHRKVAPKITKTLVERVRADVEAGALDSYVERRLEIAQTRRAANRAWGDHIKLYAATAWYRWNYDPANRNLDRVGFSHALLRIVTSDVEARGSDMDSKIRCGRGTHEDAKAMLSIREEYLAALALLDRCHAEALARGIYAAACEDKPAGNYTADRARDRKWHDVAAALVAEVSAQADA